MVKAGIVASCLFFATGALAAKMSVLVSGRIAFVRWPFDATRDLVVKVYEPANEDAFLVAKGSRTADCAQGERINSGGDDFSAIALGDFGYMSGNHGSYFGHLQTVPKHGFSEKDIGREITHVVSGASYRLVDVVDGDTILIHPDGVEGRASRFDYRTGSFRCGEHTWTPVRQTREQIFPMSRYNKRTWMDVAGCPIPEGREMTVDSADLVIDHDVVDPRAVMRYLKDHPGKRFDPALVTRWPGPRIYLETSESKATLKDFAALKTLISVRTVYRYVPYCACTIHRTTRFNADLPSVSALDVIQGWDGALPAWKDTLFYMPRTKPKTLKGNSGAADVAVDMTKGVRLPWPCWNVTDFIRKEDCTDPENMPDRFIRIGGEKNRRIGVALGYSLVDGVTALERKGEGRPYAYFFWKTGKMYPHCYDLSNVKAGTEIRHNAYRQYFDAEREPDATSFYHHREGAADYVYLDFHKTLKGKRIKLPPEYVGRPLRVLEKTSSVILRTQGTIPQNGLDLDVADGYGTLVVEIGGR